MYNECVKKLPSLSVVFPAYNDEKTIGSLVNKVTRLLPKITNEHEILVVNDGSSDNTKEVLNKIQEQNSLLRVINHKQNRGYGAALMHGFQAARKEFIFYTDGDGQYDIGELKNLIREVDRNVDIVTGFKLERSDPWFRKVIGVLYNQWVKTLFTLKVRDVDCDFRLFRRKILYGLRFRSKSGAFDAEFMKKLEERNVRFKEVGVHHYPRMYGHSQIFNVKNICKSLFDLVRFWITYEGKKKNTSH